MNKFLQRLFLVEKYEIQTKLSKQQKQEIETLLTDNEI